MVLLHESVLTNQSDVTKVLDPMNQPDAKVLDPVNQPGAKVSEPVPAEQNKAQMIMIRHLDGHHREHQFQPQRIPPQGGLLQEPTRRQQELQRDGERAESVAANREMCPSIGMGFVVRIDFTKG